MSMRIQTNVSALNAQRNLGITQNAVDASIAKLSSGFRINRAADDAAGLGIANKFRSDIRSLQQASRNAEQANSLLQIAEGATGSIQKMLERMKELGIQAASDNVTTAGRASINTEFTTLKSEIDRLISTTKFQGKTLLDGSFGFEVLTDPAASTVFAAGTQVTDVVQTGAAAGLYTLAAAAGELTMSNATVTQTVAVPTDGKQAVSFSKFGLSISLGNSYDAAAAADVGGGVISVAPGAGGGSFMVSASGDYNGADLLTLSSMNLSTSSAAGLNIGANSLSTVANAKDALTAIDLAIDKVSSVLGDIGAAQNRIENTQSNLKVSINNMSAAESVVRDLDMAEEMTNFSKSQVLAQAGTAMLAQANQAASGILQLLRG